MKYTISTGKEVEITINDKVLLIDEFQEKFKGYLPVLSTFQDYLILEVPETGEKISFSPKLIQDVAGAGTPTIEQLKPLVEQILNEELPALIEPLVLQVVKDKLTPEFFEQIAAQVVADAVRLEMSKQFSAIALILEKGP